MDLDESKHATALVEKHEYQLWCINHFDMINDVKNEIKNYLISISSQFVLAKKITAKMSKLIIINHHLCTIINITCSKTVKHGMRKYHIVGKDYENKKHEILITCYA
jgi:hypothetical protein